MRAILILALTLLAAPALAIEPAVGRLFGGGFSALRICSGTLVAPATVLTAAHCVTFSDGRVRGTRGLGFVAGWEDGRHAGAASVVEIALHPDAVDADGIVVHRDIAVLRLDRALPMEPIPASPAGVSGSFTLIGYGRADPDLQRAQQSCDGERRGRRWYLSCPVERGMSGGPVIAGENASRRIAGVISAISGEDAVAAEVDTWVLQELARPYTP
ncbi:serine protease [Roseivivax sp. THAF30]|uniref:trypsin-like serine peptidase n=1 Tax=Roseivivax sp. THAF30 TaxID=2587852 RepID=UPI0012AA7688|nr:trypsin-like peptidase domain-containing protein [Roseivivax sp. THAF30]QFT63436.1 Trypsin [Roseivivax sp. THAF30]